MNQDDKNPEPRQTESGNFSLKGEKMAYPFGSIHDMIFFVMTGEGMSKIERRLVAYELLLQVALDPGDKTHRKDFSVSFDGRNVIVKPTLEFLSELQTRNKSSWPGLPPCCEAAYLSLEYLTGVKDLREVQEVVIPLEWLDPKIIKYFGFKQ